MKSNSSTGYILEVDLEYPKNLHYEHSDYSLAPEKWTNKKNGCQIIVYELQMINWKINTKINEQK